jgi:hypothetical protein
MFYDTFACRQLVHINCTASAYVHVRLDEHSVVLGTNNQGKTSLLNSVKFFLLAEENLNDCERKFGFKSSKGFYSKVETHSWYFPDDNSFMVLEAENSHGPFCIVLHRGLKPYSYGRIAVPVPYDQIKHLFWDSASPDNGGQGAPVPTMQFKPVLSALKALGGVSINDLASIKERFFTYSQRPAEGRFCLLPLKKGGTAKEFEAWRRLIHLQFDIAAKNTRTLPDTIATIIEGDISRDEGQLGVRFDQILDEYAELRDESSRLLAIEGAIPDWERFTEACDAFDETANGLMQRLIDAEEAVETNNAAVLEQYSIAAKAADDTDRIHRESHALETVRIGEKNNLVGELKAESKSLKTAQKEVDRLARIYSEYWGMGDSEMIECLEADIEQKTKEAESLRDSAKRAEQFSTANREAKSLASQIVKISNALENDVQTVLEQLDSHSAGVLSSINQSLFGSLTLELNSDHQQAIQGFTSLFTSSGPTLCFLGEETNVRLEPYDAAAMRAKRERDLAALQSESRKNQALIKELADGGKLSQEECRQKALDKDGLVTAAQADIALLNRSKYCKDLHAEKTLAVAMLEEKINEAEEAIRELGIVVATHDVARSNARAAVDSVNKRRKNLESWHDEIGRFLNVDLAHLGPRERGFEPAPVELTEAVMKAFRDEVSTLLASLNKVQENLRVLLEKQIIEGVAVESAFAIGLGWAAMIKQRELFEMTFNRLESEIESHKSKVTAHNLDTSCQISSIKDAKRLITTFIADIEDKLSEFQVSDLEAVKIDCKLHPQFEELLVSLEGISFASDNLHTKVLYDRIASFCDSFFEKGTRQEAVLSMSRLIESVDYRVRKIGDEFFTDVAQSTGTSLMINCRLLSILMKRLLIPNTKMHLPLFIDELSNLDDKNLATARDIAEADGFFVFGATPTYTASIGSVLQNYIHLSYFTATHAYHTKRTTLFTGKSESFTEKAEYQEPAEAGTC